MLRWRRREVPLNVQGWGRLLPRDPALTTESLAAYRAQGGYEAWQTWRDRSPAELIQVVLDSGLRGRGGASFPTGRKLSSVAEREAPRYVIVNGEEGEPASYKDRTLMELRPHLVIEGAVLAGHAVGAEAIYLYLAAPFTAARDALQQAIAEAREAGLLEGAAELRFHFVERSYVAGEETAAISAIEGEEAKPRFKPPRPFEAGLWGRPTLVQNVETISNLPLIARNGAAWYREVGTPGSPGTVLITLGGSVAREGVYEVPLGTSIRTVIQEYGGGVTGSGEVLAVLPGGYFSGWIRADEIDLPLDYDVLKQHGSALGSGSVVVIDTSRNIIRETTAVMGFFANESCGKCGPCFRGNAEMAKLGRTLMETGSEETGPHFDRLKNFASTLPRRGACGHLDGGAYFVQSAVKRFEQELRAGQACSGSEECIIDDQIRRKVSS